MNKQVVVTLGELLIDFVPDINGLPLAEVNSFQRAAGGAPANVAAAVAKLGGKSRFIGKVGHDAFGDFLHSTLANVGVDSQAILHTDEARTFLAFVSLKADGERDFVFFRNPSADVLLRADEVEQRWLEDAAVYHFGSVSLVTEPCRTATLETAQRARALGALVSYDPNVRLALWPSAESARQAILQQLPLADVVKVSEEEVDFLLATDMTTGAQQLLQHGPRVVVVTMGAQGCRVVTARHDVLVPGRAVAAVDTTGAGDGFVGGMLYQFVERGITSSNLLDVLHQPGMIETIFTFANQVGAYTTQKRGAIAALPTLADLAK